MASNKKTIYEQLYDFQTRLQGVANDLGIKLAAVVSSSDQDVLKHLLKELPKEQGKSVQGELRRLQKITKGVEDIRKKSFDLAKDTLISTSLDVAKAGTDETAKEFNAALGEAARKEREKRFCKTLNEDQLKAIIDGQGIDGATIGEWFSGWQRDDLERISRAVQKATVEQLTVSDIAKQIRGTKENDYNDGILATTRVGAVRLARTVINGVCNNARVETIKANSDVIDGIKFVGTLDGKTCPHCASYDGHIWRGEDMASARRPPIHPNCRCTLVPYVELKDEEGNVVDIDNERPAANADFDQLAKDAYNQKAKEKGWKRRFEDLSPSTRLKYYYQAQKDYERETGKPAYRQVDSNLSFPEYFKQQPDSFKRDWLGAKRYEAYKEGKLTEKAIFAPDLFYRVPVEDLRLDGKTLREALRDSEIQEHFKREEMDDNLKNRESSEMLEGFEEKKTTKEAENFIKEKLNIDADYSKIPVEVANDMNQELVRTLNIFGTVGIIDNIKTDPSLAERGAFGSYEIKTKTIFLRPEYGRYAAKLYIENASEGFFSTRSSLHGYRHEIGHAFLLYCEERLSRLDRTKLGNQLKDIYEKFFIKTKDGFAQLSEYSKNGYREMVAEAFAQALNGSMSELTKQIMEVLRGQIYVL